MHNSCFIIPNSKLQEIHKPVLLKEVLEIFNPQPGQNYIDATINGGEHAREIQKRIEPGGKLLGIDWDCDLIQELRFKFQGSRFELVCDNYRNLKEIVRKHHFQPVHGILLDLGFSTYHLTQSKRGFSFLLNEPLDMRYHKENALTAEKIVNTWTGKAIEDLLREYGEERFARRITDAVLQRRRVQKISTTAELVRIIVQSVPRSYAGGKIHPATRVFQALRIAVNQELGNLSSVLPDCIDILAKEGKMVIISFHSLEDRIVKQFFNKQQKEGTVKIIYKKPLQPSEEEIRENPSSRSAKLRAILKL